jgi:hypothetical protein
MSRWQVPEHFKVLIGGNTYIDCPTIINYKGQSLFELKRSDTDGFLGINFDVYGKDGSKVSTVRNGQFVGATPSGYETDEAMDHYVLIERATGRRVCEVKLRSKASGDAELEVSAQMYMPDGRLVRFDPNQTNLGGITMTGSVFEACGAAVRID